jgi:O-antigen ligase
MVRGSLAQRAFALAALAVLANGVVQTESRGAFLGIAAGGLTMLVLSPSRLRKYWLVLGLIGLVVLIRFAPETYWERIATIAETTEQEGPVDQSSATRLELVEAQWAMFLRYPMGSGHRGTAYLSPRYLSDESLTSSRKDPNGQRARSSHNTFMTALSEQGIPGALIFTGLVVWIARTSFAAKASFQSRNCEELQLYLMAVAGSLGTVVAAGMFTDYLKSEVYIWAIALLAVLDSLRQKAIVSAGSSTTGNSSDMPLTGNASAAPPSTTGVSAGRF